jgi:hypothetical protein
MNTSTIITPTYGLLCFAKDSVSSPGQATEESSAQYRFPEIHLNIWERTNGKIVNGSASSMLDIGFMLDVKDTTESIVLIFPEKVQLDSVKDLSKIVSQRQAIPAIFNENWAIAANSTQGADIVVYDPAKQSASFAVVGITGALTETTYSDHPSLSLSVPPLISKAEKVAKSTGQQIKYVYVRFRVLEFRRDFYCVGAGERHNDWWQPTWQKTEDIDFRLNIRRGAPLGLESTIGRFLEFSKVHLFLMRSREKDIIFQDKLFNASRSLEDEDFWAQYILNEPLSSNKENIKRMRQRVKNSLGYHWKKLADSDPVKPVKEFSTLARFKVVEFGLWKFIVAAVFLNILGNMIFDGVKDWFDQEPLAQIAQAQPIQRGAFNPTKSLSIHSVGWDKLACATAVRPNTGRMSR